MHPLYHRVIEKIRLLFKQANSNSIFKWEEYLESTENA